MKLTIALIAFINLALFLVSGAQPVADKMYPSAALVRDLALIRTSVEKLHPGLGRFGPKAEFTDALDSVHHTVAQRDSTSFREFFRVVNAALVKVRCGHTKFFPPMQGYPFYFYTQQVLPCIVRFDENGKLLIVRASEPKLVGHYLVSVNDRPIRMILSELRRQLFVDGRVRSAADAQIEQYFSAWYADFVQNSEQLFLGIADAGGKTETVQVKGITSKAWEELNKNSSYLPTKNRLSFPNDSVAYLRIATFYPTEGNKYFRHFLDSSFAAVRERHIRRLIIDVRGNEGGTDALGKELYGHIAARKFAYYDRIEVKVRRKKDVPDRKKAYLPKFIGLARLFIKKDNDGRLLFKKHQNLGMQKPGRDAYDGKIWFLQDGLSYSVTSEFLAVARSENRGVFVGQESGGAYEGDNSGTFGIYKLPETGIDLGIPLAGYYSAVKPAAEYGRGVLPDITVGPSRQQLLEGIDPVMVKVLEAISADR